MKRISVSFYDEIYEQLEAHCKKINGTSIAQCVRELVDLGLKVEAAKEEKDEQPNDLKALQTMVDKLKKMVEQNLSWSLETRLISRTLLEHSKDLSDSEPKELLVELKEKAEVYVKGMCGDTVD